MGAMPPMPVTVIEAKSEQVPTLIEAVGQAESSKDVEVRASVGGYLTQQRYTEGAQVKAGATLFTIERTTFENQVSEAKATEALNRATLEKTEREVARLKPLVDEKAVTQRELDDANTALKSAQAALQASEARRRDAELHLSYTNVTAPITGIADRALLQQGTLISQGASPVLTTVHAIDPLWVRFSFSESEAMQLRKGGNKREVKLILPDGSTFDATGKINFSASTVDSKTGTVQMRAEFANPNHLLLPGQFVRVQVKMGERDAYLIPQAALADTDKGSMLFTVAPDNTVAPRPVETDGWSGQNWVVTKGLASGDKVIIDNLMKLRPGATVMPHAPGEMPPPPAGTKQ
jgi:membrane fusion protein (multidrug efflux system)